MSDHAYDRYGYPREDGPAGGGASVLTSWLGALVSVGLVAGLGVWSYKLAIRDVTGVPVIRAMVGPMRIQPADPGGERAAYQGLAVNVVQAEGSVAAPAQRVVLAPAPVALTGQDIVEAKLHPQPRDGQLKSEPENVTDVSAVDEMPVTGKLSKPTGRSAIDAAVKIAVSEGLTKKMLAKIARLPGVKRSPRPKMRSAARVATIAPGLDAGSGGTAVPASATSSIDVDPATIVAGTKLVQLGAFDDRKSAIQEWNNIIERHGDLIGSRKRLILEATAGGRIFYRLRMVGFSDINDSRRLCSALVARGTPCIPVTAR